MENYITKTGKSKLNNKHLANLMYAIVICKAKLLSTHGIGIYNLTKTQNSRHSYEFLISINQSIIPLFEELSNIKLNDPIKISY
jgi:hypothetical protein